MKNYLLIQVTQSFPTWIGKQLRSLRSLTRGKAPASPPFLAGIDHFPSSGDKDRRALLMMPPSTWLSAVSQYPAIRFYNSSGLLYSLVQALNENGFLVDLADASHQMELTNNYDLFVGHGSDCRPFIDRLAEGTPIYHYIAGPHWQLFERESDERYDRFFSERGCPRPDSHRRSITPMIEGLTYLIERTDVFFTINCPRMIASYGRFADKFYFTGLGAYIDDLFRTPPEEKDFDAGRKNFIYVGGTGGNLQKGLDLLIEAFAKMPDLHLYIYCKVEEDLLEHCRSELALPNIHYIYHWRFAPFHGRLKSLLRELNFSVHAPINIGMGTAFMATMGVGLIPVGYIDLADPGESAVLTDSWQVESLAACIRTASEKSPDWCERASGLTVDHYSEFSDPEKVGENFQKMFAACADRDAP